MDRILVGEKRGRGWAGRFLGSMRLVHIRTCAIWQRRRETNQCTILGRGISSGRRKVVMLAFQPICMGCMVLTCRGRLDIAVQPNCQLLSAKYCPSSLYSRRQLTRPSFEVCALTAAKGVCSGSTESIFRNISWFRVYVFLATQFE